MSTRPLMQRDYYTTGEMARAMVCAQQTVIRQIDAGKIPAFRLAGTKFRQRRCPKHLFRQYLIRHGIPTTTLDELERRAAFAAEFRTGGKNRG